jgi:hypothetical protein
MFRITQDPSSGSFDLDLIKNTRSGSTVLVVKHVGVILMCFILEFYITDFNIYGI